MLWFKTYFNDYKHKIKLHYSLFSIGMSSSFILFSFFNFPMYLISTIITLSFWQIGLISNIKQKIKNERVDDKFFDAYTRPHLLFHISFTLFLLNWLNIGISIFISIIISPIWETFEWYLGEYHGKEVYENNLNRFSDFCMALIGSFLVLFLI